MKHFFTIVFTFFCFQLFGQRTHTITTNEILKTFETYGTDSALRKFGPDIPLYLIDTTTALKIAYSCTDIGKFSRQIRFASETGMFIHDDKLNIHLLDLLRKYRIEFLKTSDSEDPDYPPKINNKLLYAIEFQNKQTSLPILNEEMLFWKEQWDSLTKLPESKRNNYYIYPFNDNYYIIAWALNKLTNPQYSNSEQNSFEQDRRIAKLLINGGYTDTCLLSKKYSSLDKIDYLNEPGVNALYKFTGKPDNDCSMKMYFNSNNAIIYLFRSFPSGHIQFASYKLTLISQDKISIVSLSLGQS